MNTKSDDIRGKRAGFERWWTQELKKKQGQTWTLSEVYQHVKRLYDFYEDHPLKTPQYQQEDGLTKDSLVLFLQEILEHTTPDRNPAQLAAPTMPGFSSASLAVSLLEKRLEAHRDGLKPLSDKELVNITKILVAEKPTVDGVLLLLNSLFFYLQTFYALTVDDDTHNAIHGFLCDFRQDMLDDLAHQHKTLPTVYKLQKLT